MTALDWAIFASLALGFWWCCCNFVDDCKICPDTTPAQRLSLGPWSISIAGMANLGSHPGTPCDDCTNLNGTYVITLSDTLAPASGNCGSGFSDTFTWTCAAASVTNPVSLRGDILDNTGPFGGLNAVQGVFVEDSDDGFNPKFQDPDPASSSFTLSEDQCNGVASIVVPGIRDGWFCDVSSATMTWIGA